MPSRSALRPRPSLRIPPLLTLVLLLVVPLAPAQGVPRTGVKEYVATTFVPPETD